MSIFVFIAVIIIAYFAIRIGAAALELTGLNVEQAQFQSISAFTGTGFTTREAELIVSHKQRRKITSILMILGTAGFATLIATLVRSIDPRTVPEPIISAWRGMPVFLVPYANLAVILFLLFLIYRLFHTSKLSSILMDKLQKGMVDKKLIQPVYFEELLLNARGYGVSKIEITEKNPLCNKTLSDSRLRKHDIMVLSIERGREHMLNPTANINIEANDKLVCFGKLDNIRKIAYEEVG